MEILYSEAYTLLPKLNNLHFAIFVLSHNPDSHHFGSELILYMSLIIVVFINYYLLVLRSVWKRFLCSSANFCPEMQAWTCLNVRVLTLGKDIAFLCSHLIFVQGSSRALFSRCGPEQDQQWELAGNADSLLSFQCFWIRCWEWAH